MKLFPPTIKTLAIEGRLSFFLDILPDGDLVIPSERQASTTASF